MVVVALQFSQVGASGEVELGNLVLATDQDFQVCKILDSLQTIYSSLGTIYSLDLTFCLRELPVFIRIILFDEFPEGGIGEVGWINGN